MPRRRTSKKHGRDSVELNLAAMLDMAFQLLTFFILTFKPAPLEGEIALRMPQAAPPGAAAAGQSLGSSPAQQALKSLDTITISLRANAQGQLDGIAIEDQPIDAPSLNGRLKSLFGNSDSRFKQVVIQTGSRLHYDALMNVVDQCAKQRRADGTKLDRLGFVEWPDGG